MTILVITIMINALEPEQGFHTMNFINNNSVIVGLFTYVSNAFTIAMRTPHVKRIPTFT